MHGWHYRDPHPVTDTSWVYYRVWIDALSFSAGSQMKVPGILFWVTSEKETHKA